MAPQKPIEIAPRGKHTATLIMAHGLGDTGLGWTFLAEQWRMQNKFDHVKFIFPNAPTRKITINMGEKMPGWYDITSLGAIDRSEDETGIAESQKFFHDLINTESETTGIPEDRIVLGGFSQGGAIALLAGLSYPGKLGGVVGLSCYLLLRNKFRGIADAGANKETRIFMGHGDVDQVVRYQFGKLTADTLTEWGYKVDFKTYRGLGHSADPEEIKDFEDFLKKTIPPLLEESSQGNL